MSLCRGCPKDHQFSTLSGPLLKSRVHINQEGGTTHISVTLGATDSYNLVASSKIGWPDQQTGPHSISQAGHTKMKIEVICNI